MIKKRDMFEGRFLLHGFFDVVSIFVMETIQELQKARVRRI